MGTKQVLVRSHVNFDVIGEKAYCSKNYTHMEMSRYNRKCFSMQIAQQECVLQDGFTEDGEPTVL